MTTEDKPKTTTEAPPKEDTPKASRGERKFKKAMMKLGLKPMEGFTRATLKTGKNMMLYIDNPFIMNTGANEHNYIIFGEPKLLDFKSALSSDKLKKFQESRKADDKNVPDTIKEVDEGENAEAAKEEFHIEEEVEEGKYPEEDIKSIIEYSNCDRKAAIRALAKAGGDVIDAISFVG